MILKALSPSYALGFLVGHFGTAFFSLTAVVLAVAQQAARLGYLPRLRIQYTSEQVRGQIYVPWINWLLLVSVLTLVLAFRSSAALAYAYGTAVTGTITITTLLFFYYAVIGGAGRYGSC